VVLQLQALPAEAGRALRVRCMPFSAVALVWAALVVACSSTGPNGWRGSCLVGDGRGGDSGGGLGLAKIGRVEGMEEARLGLLPIFTSTCLPPICCPPIQPGAAWQARAWTKSCLARSSRLWAAGEGASMLPHVLRLLLQNAAACFASLPAGAPELSHSWLLASNARSMRARRSAAGRKPTPQPDPPD